jgi:hypothetical protein
MRLAHSEIAGQRTARGLAAPLLNDSNVPSLVGAFTLIEVMIASGILFICLFAILGLLANTLRNARVLQRKSVDAGMLAAELSLTNKLYEGSDSGNFENLYPGYRWRQEIVSVETNGLFVVDFAISRAGADNSESHMTILLFRPESPTTPGGGGIRR